MKIIVVSDTHGRTEALENLLAREDVRKADWLVHCGDIGDDERWLRNAFAGAVSIVAGNCDYFTDLPKELTVEREGRRFLITHGHRYLSGGISRLWYRAKEEACDVVLFGHTHMPLVAEEDGVLFVNPGSVALPRQADRRRTYAVINVENGKASAHIEDVELRIYD